MLIRDFSPTTNESRETAPRRILPYGLWGPHCKARAKEESVLCAPTYSSFSRRSNQDKSIQPNRTRVGLRYDGLDVGHVPFPPFHIFPAFPSSTSPSPGLTDRRTFSSSGHSEPEYHRQ
jgi:hypothetical protein